MQQILKGTYKYPHDLNPATRLLFKEAAVTYAALSLTKIATYVTVEDFQHFWQTAREHTRLSYSGLHFGHYMAASFCLDLSLRMGCPWHDGVKASQSYWKRKLRTFLSTSYTQLAFLRPTVTGGIN
jgi:hypothetical protein